tara:strand:- start:31 stop:1797 length:1767 start_codon:yes stop_codon:yes gene_type:complete
MKKGTNNHNSFNSFNNNGEIDLLFLIRFIRRNLKFISYSSILFLIFGIFFAQTRKQVWEGQFEIVIEKSKNSNSNIQIPQNISSIANFANLQNLAKPNSLNTEVGILQSSSVLLPIFENLKNERLNSNQNNNPLNFSSFKSNLKISLRNKTSILNIKYRDTKKERILPVLKQISLGYQKYSGANKERVFKLAEDYLEKQIKEFRFKSNKSIKEVQEYAIDKDLTILNTNKSSNNIENLYKSKSSIDTKSSQSSPIISDIERIRINAVNEIKTIDMNLKKLKDFDNDKDIISFVFNEIPQFSSSKIKDIIEKNELNFLELKFKYKKNDKRLNLLKEERKVLGQLIKEKAITFLEDKKFAFQAKIESASRPKEVLIKYRELLRNSERDELTLIGMENQLRSIQLEKSRIVDPWKLITEPQLKSSYVEPNKTRILLIALFLGIITGSIIAKLKEVLSGLVFEKETIEKTFSSEFISTFILDNNKTIEKNKLFEDIINSSKEKNVNLIYFGGKSDFVLPIVNNYLAQFNKKEKRIFIFQDDLSDLCANYENHLIIEDSDILLEEIFILLKRFEILGIKIKGIFDLKINVNLY